MGCRQALAMVVTAIGCSISAADAQTWQESRDFFLTEKRSDLTELCGVARQLNSRGEMLWTSETRNMMRTEIAKEAAADGVRLTPDRYEVHLRGMEAALQIACPGVR